MSRVIIAGCEDAVGRALAEALSGLEQVEVESQPTLEAASTDIDGAGPAVVVVCPPVDPVEGIALAMLLQRRESDTAVVLVAEDLDADMLRAALKAGVRDVFTPADGVQTIAAAVRAAEDGFRRRQAALGDRPPEEPVVHAGTVVTVFSTKGGVGKSVISTNLGVALVRETGKKTILVDLDLEFGDVSVMLQLPPKRTIFDAAKAFDRLDPEMLQGFLVEHSSGLKTLLAPVRPEDAESVTPGRIRQIIEMVRTLADYVVIDTPASLSDAVLTALELSDLVLTVATLDVPSVKNTKVSLQKLHQLGLGGDKVRLVLNRADSKVWLEPQEIEKAITDRIVARIPSDRLVPRSVNKGVPVVLDAPRSAVARSILDLARDVAATRKS
jgi:pilus assembly protein CpaE